MRGGMTWELREETSEKLDTLLGLVVLVCPRLRMLQVAPMLFEDTL